VGFQSFRNRLASWVLKVTCPQGSELGSSSGRNSGSSSSSSLVVVVVGTIEGCVEEESGSNVGEIGGQRGAILRWLSSEPLIRSGAI